MRAPYRCDAFYDVLRRLPHEPDPRRVDAAAGPVRIVWGSEDRLLPLRGYSERWRRLLPSAEWVVLEGAGHVPMYDDPARVAELILEVTAAASAARRTKAPSIKAGPTTAPATLRPPAEARAAADG